MDNNAYQITPIVTLMNGKGPLGHILTTAHESFTVEKGKIQEGINLYSENLVIDLH